LRTSDESLRLTSNGSVSSEGPRGAPAIWEILI
jgi:hypothetical protein